MSPFRRFPNWAVTRLPSCSMISNPDCARLIVKCSVLLRVPKLYLQTICTTIWAAQMFFCSVLRNTAQVWLCPIYRSLNTSPRSLLVWLQVGEMLPSFCEVGAVIGIYIYAYIFQTCAYLRKGNQIVCLSQPFPSDRSSQK